MNTKDYLYQARKIDYELDALIRARQKVYEQFTSATAVLSAEPKGGANPHKFDKLAELNDSIDELVNENLKIKSDTIAAISALPNKEWQAILTDYYINGLSVPQIAQKMHFSERNVRRAKKEAVNALSELKLSAFVLDCPP